MSVSSIPNLPPTAVQWPDFQVWWQLAKTEIEAILTAQQTQLNDLTTVVNAIAAIVDPNTLTPDKKPIWMFVYSYLTGEQSDLDAKATTYSITTEKTNYDNAITALTSHLSTLTTPVAWNDTSGNTTIVDTTFRSKFTDVMTKKQALINKITAQAKALADAAQAQANTATSNAATAQSTANTAQSTATTANSTATTANSNAVAAAREAARINSYTNPGVGIITASDTGSNAKIAIAAHTRVYPVEGGIDVPDLSIAANASAVTALSYSTTYFVYYDDTSLTDTTPTFHATTSAASAQVGAAAGRHFVGVVTTPAAGGGATSGDGTSPPGATGGSGTGGKYLP